MSGEEADLLLVGLEVSVSFWAVCRQAGLSVRPSCSASLEGLSEHSHGLTECSWQLVFSTPSSCHVELLKGILLSLHTVRSTCSSQIQWFLVYLQNRTISTTG